MPRNLPQVQMMILDDIGLGLVHLKMHETYKTNQFKPVKSFSE